MMNMNPRSTKRELYKKGGIDKGKKNQEDKGGGNCCYVDDVGIFLSFFLFPSSPLGPSDESNIFFLQFLLSLFFF